MGYLVRYSITQSSGCEGVCVVQVTRRQNQNTSKFSDVGILYSRGKYVILVFSEPSRIALLITFYWHNLIDKLFLCVCGKLFTQEYTNHAVEINASVTEYDREMFCGALYFILT